MQIEADNVSLLNPEILDQLLAANEEINIVSIGGDISSNTSNKLANIIQRHPQVNTIELNEDVPPDAANALASRILENTNILYVYINREFPVDKTIAFIAQLSKAKSRKIIYFASTNKALKNYVTKMKAHNVLEFHFIA